MHKTETLACACGQFHLEFEGEPFITAQCHCKSCRSAAERLAALPPAFSLTDTSGGVPYILYRKDRVRFPQGTAGLAEFRLSETAPTRRVLTTCCNTPVFTEFEGGHWLSLFAGLWPETKRPSMQIRTQTADATNPAALDDSIPSGALTTAGFYAKLLAIWIAMGFKSPKLDVPHKISV